MEDHAAGSPGLAPLAISLCLTEMGTRPRYQPLMDTTWTSTKRPEGKGPRPPFLFPLSPSSPLIYNDWQLDFEVTERRFLF